MRVTFLLSCPRTCLAVAASLLLLAGLGTPSASGTMQPSTASQTPAPSDTPRPGPDPRRPLVVGAWGTPDIGVISTARNGQISVVPGSPFPSAPNSLALVITPDAKTVLRASLSTSTITSSRLGPDGTISAIPGGSLTVEGPVSGLAITPDGETVFATVGGNLRSYAVDAAGLLTPTEAPAAMPGGIGSVSQVAITPDARHVVVTNYLSGSVSLFAVGGRDKVSLVDTQRTGPSPVMPAFTPNGRFLYVSNESGGSVSGYLVTEAGLEPTPGSPYRTSSTPHGVAITPDGRRLYVPNGGVDATGDNSISGFRISPKGALRNELPGSPYSPPGAVGRVVLSHDGRFLYVVEGVGNLIGAPAGPEAPGLSVSKADEGPQDNPATSQVHSFAVRDSGRIVPSGAPSVDMGVLWHDGSAAFLTPNSGPVAHVDMRSRRGRTVTFTGAQSSDADGAVARYVWRFSDGSRATTTSPIVTHTFKSRTRFGVRLRVVDDEGCSMRLVYMGTTATCLGSERAKSQTMVSGTSP